MAKNAVTDWDATAGNNTDIGGNTLNPDVATTALVDNYVQEVMSQIATHNPVAAGVATSLSSSQQAQARTNISAALRGHIFGLTLSNNGSDATNDIDIAAGEAASDGNNPVLMALSSTLTKRLDASWAVGDGNGGLDTGSIADTTYFVWLIRRSDTGVVDALFSASASSPTMPTNYDQKRYIGAIIRDSSAILGFHQDGDDFWLTTPEAATPTSSLSTSASTITLNVPVGISVLAFISGYTGNASADVVIYLSSPFQDDDAPGASAGTANSPVGGVNTFFTANVLTGTAANIRARSQAASTTLGVIVNGWRDRRGKNA